MPHSSSAYCEIISQCMHSFTICLTSSYRASPPAMITLRCGNLHFVGAVLTYVAGLAIVVEYPRMQTTFSVTRRLHRFSRSSGPNLLISNGMMFSNLIWLFVLLCHLFQVLRCTSFSCVVKPTMWPKYFNSAIRR